MTFIWCARKQNELESLTENMGTTTGCAVFQLESTGRSIFKGKDNTGIVVEASSRVEHEPAAIVPSALNSCKRGGFDDTAASIQDTQTGVVQIANVGVGLVEAKRRSTCDWVLFSERYFALGEAGRLVGRHFVPRLPNEIHSARRTAEIAGAGHDSVDDTVSAIDAQDLSAQSRTINKTLEVTHLPKSQGIGHRVTYRAGQLASATVGRSGPHSCLS